MDEFFYLKTQQEILSRVTHALRGSLGVAGATLKDLKKGMTLSEQELQDGVDALQRTLEIVDFLRGMSSSGATNIEKISLEKLFFSFPVKMEMSSETAANIFVTVQPRLFEAALRYLIQYLDHRSLTPPEKIFFVLSEVADRQLQLCAECELRSAKSVPPEPTLESLASADHSVEAAGLFFAAQAFKAQHIQTEVCLQQNCLQFTVLLPTFV